MMGFFRAYREQNSGAKTIPDGYGFTGSKYIPQMSSSASIALDKGLPTNLDAERFVLGSILMDDAHFVTTAGVLDADDFSLEKHRRIFKRMGSLRERAEKIDRVTLANELMRYGELES